MSSNQCAGCGQELPDQVLFCPACGTATSAQPAVADPSPSVALLQPVISHTTQTKDSNPAENLASALAYVTFIPALIFLFREPYRSNPEVRFHAFQCLLLWAAGVVLAIGLKLLSLLSLLLAAPIALVLLVGAVILWVVLMLKAYLGQDLVLPLVGEWAQGFAQLS
jgi:uncharacterized membrane protein